MGRGTPIRFRGTVHETLKVDRRLLEEFDWALDCDYGMCLVHTATYAGQGGGLGTQSWERSAC